MSVTLQQQGDIRPMKLQDMPAVLRMEQQGHPFPWSEQIFRDCMRAGYACRVLQQGEDIVAYGVMSSGAGETHILNLCVDPLWQGRGIGRRLLEYFIAQAREGSNEAMFLEVRVSNERARQLYLRLGFNEVGLRKNYYPASAGREDALILALALL